MNKITKEQAEKLYTNGDTIYVGENNLPEETLRKSLVPLQKSDHKHFSDVMTEWYFFNHWSNHTPHPVFFSNEH